MDQVFALHCDPGTDVGQVGLRTGAITAATDVLTVRLTGAGGHTSRPHITQDLTYALATVVTGLPAALSRRVDPRAGLALVWGSIHAGEAGNVIPSTGTASAEDCPVVRLTRVSAMSWARVRAMCSTT